MIGCRSFSSRAGRFQGAAVGDKAAITALTCGMMFCPCGCSSLLAYRRPVAKHRQLFCEVLRKGSLVLPLSQFSGALS